MHAGYLYLAGRVIGMGLERPLVKRLGQGSDPIAVVVTYVGLGEFLFALIIAAQALQNPLFFSGALAWLPWALIPGLCYAVSFFSFIRAMQLGEVSLLTPLFATAFVMLYAIDVAAGYARLGWLPLSGVLLVALGVAWLRPASTDEPRHSLLGLDWRRLNPSWLLGQPGALLMLLNALGVAVGRYFDKTLVDAHLGTAAPPVLYALVVNAPTVFIGLVLLARRGRTDQAAGPGELARLLRTRWAIALTLVLTGQGAYLLLLLSLNYFPPSVIEPVTQLGVFIAIALGGLWFREPVRARWLPSAMVVGGAIVLLS
jgi:drug/metabolite transporter (DMT)-like permease